MRSNLLGAKHEWENLVKNIRSMRLARATLKGCSEGVRVVRIKCNLLSVAPSWMEEMGWEEALCWDLYL